MLSFTATSQTAVSRVRIGSTFEVTHDYHPSPATPYLFEGLVSVKNITTGTVEVLYRRVVDWDPYPTPFSEFVTIVNGTSPYLLRTDTNGFNSANPLQFQSFQPGPVLDLGPDDLGALYDLDFGPLAAGQTRTFKIFYGAAGTEDDADAALIAAAAEAYSYAQPNVAGGPIEGTPNTFMLAFGGISGGQAACNAAVDCFDGNPCTMDACTPSVGCEHPPATAGTSCGDAGGECVLPDTCDGAGACADNSFMPVGTSCTDPSGLGCTGLHGCDASGMCDAGADGIDDEVFDSLRIALLPGDDLELTWDPPSPPPGMSITGYRVLRREFLACPWEVVAVVQDSPAILPGGDGLNVMFMVTAITVP